MAGALLGCRLTPVPSLSPSRLLAGYAVTPRVSRTQRYSSISFGGEDSGRPTRAGSSSTVMPARSAVLFSPSAANRRYPRYPAAFSPSPS